MREPTDTKRTHQESIDHRPRVAAERRERMRTRLLHSALHLVSEKGPAATSIDDIIAATQVSRGTFYKYFPSPEALIQELAAEIANELIRIAEPAIRNHDDPAELVARGIRLVSRLAIHNPVVAKCMVRLGWSAERGGVNMVKFVIRDLEEGFQRGRFKRMPMALALNIVTGAVLWATERMLESKSKEDSSKQAAAIALRALGVDSAEADAISKKSIGSTQIRIVGWLADSIVELD